MPLSAVDGITMCSTLKNNWSARTKKFKDWYDILLLVDELAQEGVESVVSNDPRTGYNLAKHMLVSMIIADKIPGDDLKAEFIPGTVYMEKYIANRWKDQEKRYRSIGRQSWIGEVASWMLALGWYSVFAMVTADRVWSEVWSPNDCFPAFGPDGLVEHAHIYTMPAIAANKKVKQMNWVIARPFNAETTFYDYWGFDNEGDPVNFIVADNQFVKVPTKDPAVAKTGRLPVFSSAVGGLPDMGSIKGNGLWQHHYGESIIATNEDLSHNYNKMRSFMQQAARTAAQPHWLELSSGGTPIATDELMNRWGSVLHGQPGESVNAITGAPIPIELTNIQLTYLNELQRGLFPAAVFGNLQQQMSYLAMANVASAAMQILTPHRNAIIGMRTDVNNFWQEMILKNDFAPHGFVKPEVLADSRDMQFDVEADIEIPGYIVQKATVGRMLNPQFELPVEWIREKLFPEITDPIKATAQLRAEKAMMDPKAILGDNILAYREAARVQRELGEKITADMYEKIADSWQAELDQPKQPIAPVPQGVAPIEIPKELSIGDK